MRSRRLLWLAAVFAVLSLPLLALSVSFGSCEDFPFFDARNLGLGTEEAQRQAQEWADDQQSRVGCPLLQSQALGGVGKAHYQEPAPVVPIALYLATATSAVAAVALGVAGWQRRKV